MGCGESSRSEDPNTLVAIVHRTHFTYVGGATPAVAKINIQKSFNALEQGPFRSISEFKNEIVTLVRCMRGANIPGMDGETSAICFLEKLDQNRHGAMLLYLTNGKVAGQAFWSPQTRPTLAQRTGRASPLESQIRAESSRT